MEQRITRGAHEWRKAGGVVLGLGLVLSGGLVSPVALADEQRLEDDLARWFESGRLHHLEVSQPSAELTRATDIAIAWSNGERLQVEQYDVEGDYDDPDRVVLSGVVLTAADMRVDVARIEIDDPSEAVWRLDSSEPELSAAGIHTEDLVLTGRVSDADLGIPPDYAEPSSAASHRIEVSIDSITAGALDMAAEHGSLESVSVEGLAGSSNQPRLEGWRLALELFSLSDFTWGKPRDALLIGGMDLAGLAVDKDDVSVAGISRLTSTTEITAERFTSQTRLDEAFVDFNRLIALTPAEGRTVMRMVNNVMTGGSERFSMSGEGSGAIDANGASVLAHADSHINASDAFELTVNYEFPLALPKGETAEDLFTRFADYGVAMDPRVELDQLWFPVKPLGGRLGLVYHDLGMVDRLMSVAAVTTGQSRSELLEGMAMLSDTETIGGAGQDSRFAGLGGSRNGENELFDSVLTLLEGDASVLHIDLEVPKSLDIRKLADNPEKFLDHLIVTASVE